MNSVTLSGGTSISSSGSSHQDPEPLRRRPRADAQRNREALLAAAREAFGAGADPETVSLEAIARAAGVGIGTLYRNFPDRQDLVAAIYRSGLEDVVDSAAGLLAGAPADVAFRAWLDRYAGFVATKRGMADMLRHLLASGVVDRSDTRARIRATVDTFLRAGAADHTLRHDVLADDVVTTLLGAFLATADTTDGEQISRILDLILDGLRPHQA